MDLAQQALRISEGIYEAAIDPDRWQDVVTSLSEAFGGAYVGFGLNHPTDPLAGTAYLVGITPEYRRTFVESLIGGLPFAAHFGQETSKRFIDVGELFPEIELVESDFYREWMAPQHLAPCWPIGCSIWLEARGPAAWMYLWRPEGGEPFASDDLALCDLLLPHLHRAVRIHLALMSSQHRGRALGEVIDRLPTGVLLLDAERRVVSTNRSAHHILAAKDGFEIGSCGPVASDRHDNDALRRLLSEALDPAPCPDPRTHGDGFTTIRRPSGKRSYVVMAMRLLDAATESDASDAVAALLVADPEATHASEDGVLADLYRLTPAEADLMQLLSSGYTLEEAAARRSVSINTTRAQLKRLFAKTDTRRQAELVRLVLNGVGTLRER